MSERDGCLGHYDPDGQVNVTGFAGSLAAFTGGVLATALALRARGHRVPDSFAAADLLVGGVAVHKLARLVTKSSVASPLRAPFTQFEEAIGASEHAESPRGDHGVRHTVGELITCPFCFGVWLSGAYVTGLIAAPRPTRAAAALLVVSAVSDSMQHVYARLRV